MPVSFLNKIAIKTIKLYQKTLSPDHSLFSSKKIFCTFIPTCSEYAIQSFEKYNFLKALYKSINRIIRCTPSSKHKIDIP